MDNETSLLRRGLQWGRDTIEWWPFVLDGDDLVADLSAERITRSVTAVEDERRLYLRLTDAVESRPNGEVVLRARWRRLALDFANRYFPPVIDTMVRDRDRIPVARFAEEALLMWWAVDLKRQLEQPTPDTLEEALTAVVQVLELFPDADPDDAGHRWLLRNLAVLTSLYPAPFNARVLPPKALEVEPGTPPESLNPDRMTPKEWLSHLRLHETRVRPATAVISLGRRLAQRRVDDFRAAHADDEQALWAVASRTLASLVNLKLAGISPICHGPGSGGANVASISIGFGVLSPLGRIWYGLWESMGGVRIRACQRAKCGRLFTAAQETQRFCTTKCNDAERQQRKRDSDALTRRAARQPGEGPRSTLGATRGSSRSNRR